MLFLHKKSHCSMSVCHVGSAPACCHSPGASFTGVGGGGLACHCSGLRPDPISGCGLLVALGSPDTAPVQEAPLSTPLQDSAADCADPALLSTRTAHFSDSALHDTSKASNKSLLICQNSLYRYLHSPQLFFLLAVTTLESTETGAGNPKPLLMQPKS